MKRLSVNDPGDSVRHRVAYPSPKRQREVLGSVTRQDIWKPVACALGSDRYARRMHRFGTTGLVALLLATASTARAQTLVCATISHGGGVLADGSIGIIGQHLTGTMSNASFTIEVGLVPCLSTATACPASSQPLPEQILDASDNLVTSAKSRFLSFSGGDAGLSQAVRVKFVSLPGSFSVFNGTSAWVDLPQLASELPGKSLTDPIGAEPTFLAASLSATPVFADWSTFGTIHVHDERIIPSRQRTAQPLEPAVYEIQFVTDGCDFGNESSFSVALEITNARWADIAQLAGGQFRAPDGTIAVGDTLALLAKFSGNAGAPTKARAELLGVAGGPVAPVDGVISVSDLLEVLSAFSGGEYPFTP